MSPVAFFNMKNGCKCLILRSRSRINSWNSQIKSLHLPWRDRADESRGTCAHRSRCPCEALDLRIGTSSSPLAGRPFLKQDSQGVMMCRRSRDTAGVRGLPMSAPQGLSLTVPPGQIYTHIAEEGSRRAFIFQYHHRLDPRA